MLAMYPDELRADLQQYYGLDIDRDLYGGGHSVYHVATCAAQLPSDARVRVAADPDSVWTLPDILSAQMINLYMAAHSEKGRRPKPIGPSYIQDDDRKLPAMVMPIDELERKLKEFERG